MRSHGISAPILALLAATLALGAAGAANAQGAPVYIGPGAPPPFEPPRYVRAEPLPDDVLLPQEIVGILRSTGFSPLSAPIRRGRFYLVAALHPDGEDGQVTMDAVTGRFIRFVPADLIGRSMASYPPPTYVPPRRGGLAPADAAAGRCRASADIRHRCRRPGRPPRPRRTRRPRTPRPPISLLKRLPPNLRTARRRARMRAKAGRSGRNQAKLQQTGGRADVATDEADAAGTGFRITRTTERPGQTGALRIFASLQARAA